MALFEEYRPAERGERLPGVLYRMAEAEDAPELTELMIEREGGERERVRRVFEREGSGFFPRDVHRLWVAEYDGRTLGFGRSKYFRPEPDAPAGVAPEGWYLGGVIVSPALRRRGIARGLTRARIQDLQGEAKELFYVANVLNRASIALHADFGFVEVTREFVMPGVTYKGGEGALFRLGLAGGA